MDVTVDRALSIFLGITAALLIFVFGFLVGAGRGLDLMRQQAVDEGFAVRDPDFRWRSSRELERKPARRPQGP